MTATLSTQLQRSGMAYRPGRGEPRARRSRPGSRRRGVRADPEVPALDVVDRGAADLHVVLRLMLSRGAPDAQSSGASNRTRSSPPDFARTSREIVFRPKET